MEIDVSVDEAKFLLSVINSSKVELTTGQLLRGEFALKPEVASVKEKLDGIVTPAPAVEGKPEPI
jgi:hypothetical protein